MKRFKNTNFIKNGDCKSDLRFRNASYLFLSCTKNVIGIEYVCSPENNMTLWTTANVQKYHLFEWKQSKFYNIAYLIFSLFSLQLGP